MEVDSCSCSYSCFFVFLCIQNEKRETEVLFCSFYEKRKAPNGCRIVSLLVGWRQIKRYFWNAVGFWHFCFWVVSNSESNKTMCFRPNKVIHG